MSIAYLPVEIEADCTGVQWVITDEAELAGLVGLVAKCEFAHVQCILHGITEEDAEYSDEIAEEIKQAAIASLTILVDGTGKEIPGGRQYHRDGFLFEAISWLVARKSNGENVLLRDPHIGSTTQGLDGLMIQLTDDGNDVVKTTVFEDKCTEDARATFRDMTLPAFAKHHIESRKVLESATTLLRQSVSNQSITRVAARSIRQEVRQYRSSLTILAAEDNEAGRKRIFKGYGSLDGLQQGDRIGCTFVPAGDVRSWFSQFAKKVIATF